MSKTEATKKPSSGSHSLMKTPRKTASLKAFKPRQDPSAITAQPNYSLKLKTSLREPTVLNLDLNSKIPQLNTLYNPMKINELPPSIFSWRDALYLSRWDICAVPTPEQAFWIMRVAHTMMLVSQYFNKPIKVNSWLRPTRYNSLVGGATNSPHLEGKAIDFVIEGVDCDAVRSRLKSELDLIQARVQNHKPGTSWVHLDLREPGPSGRYFK